MIYSEFKNWKNSHSLEMQDLTFAKPDDIFIYTRFSGHSPFDFDSKQLLFAENLNEAIGYIRHIFLYDILNDTIDDLEFDFKSPFDKRQEDAVSILNFWFMLGKISDKNSYQDFVTLCEDFNSKFNDNQRTEYEIKILNGADELQQFLIKNYSQNENFDKEKLCNICSNDLFAGKPLKDLIFMLFR